MTDISQIVVVTVNRGLTGPQGPQGNPGDLSGYTGLSTTAAISAGLHSGIASNSAAISATNLALGSLGSTVVAVSASLQSQISGINLQPYALTTTVAAVSAGLQSEIASINLSPYALTSTVSAVSAGLQSEIAGVYAFGFATTGTVAAISAGLNASLATKLTSSSLAPYELMSASAAVSAGLQSQIVANTGTLATHTTQIAAMSGSLATKIDAPALQPYTLLTTSAAISAGLQTQINNISGASGANLSNYTLLATTAAISAGLQTQINNISGASGLSNYTLLATTAAISAGLNTRINANTTSVVSLSGAVLALQNSTTAPGSGRSGQIYCDTTNFIYTISDPTINVNSQPVVSLVTPATSSNLYVAGIVAPSAGQFTVVLSGVPPVSGYAINWKSGSFGGLAYGNVPLGQIVGDTDTQTLTNKRIVPRVVNLLDTATVTPSADIGDVFKLNSTQNFTLAAPTGTPTDGQEFRLEVLTSTPRTISYNGIYAPSNGQSLPTVTTGNSKYDYILFGYNPDYAHWECLAANISGAGVSVDLSGYTTLATTAAISAGLNASLATKLTSSSLALYELISASAAVSAGLQAQISAISGNNLTPYTLLTTTAAVSAGLQSQITSAVGVNGNQATQITAISGAIGSYCTTSTVAAVSAGIFTHPSDFNTFINITGPTYAAINFNVPSPHTATILMGSTGELVLDGNGGGITLNDDFQITFEAGNYSFGDPGVSFGSGSGIIFIANRGSGPVTPVGGGFLYTESGALKYKGSSGTVTTIAPA